uniref:AA_permease domain-containing protein n=1 Tax=Steinernema glaseri TaxID=37863 RepID=A0A1I7XWI9_9BILA
MAPQGHKIGVLEAASYCVGDIIGSGIFVSPTSILQHTGSVGLSLCLWAACAGISVVGALVYIELGTSIQKSGCDFAYLSHVKWHPLAVAFLWVSCCLSYPSTLAIQSATLGKYVISGLTPLLDLKLTDSTLFYLERLIAFSVLWVLTFINMFSLKRFAARFQQLATLAKLLATALIIVTGFYYIIFKGYTRNFEDSFKESTTKPGNIVLGLYAGLFAYNGWDILNFGAEEIENPRRTMPIAALCGIGISALVFISMNVSYFALLTVEEFKQSETVAMTFAERTLGNFSYVVPFLIAILLLGNLNTTIFGCSRYLFAGAARRVMPSFIRTVHGPSMSPRVAVFIELMVCVCVSFAGNLDHLISYMMFTIWMQRTIVQVALLYMRFSDYPVSPNGFRNPIIVPILFLLICLCLLVIPIWQDFYVAVYGLGLTFLGLAIYLVFILPSKLPKLFSVVDEKLTVLFQIVFNVIPAEYAQSGDSGDTDLLEDILKSS